MTEVSSMSSKNPTVEQQARTSSDHAVYEAFSSSWFRFSSAIGLIFLCTVLSLTRQSGVGALDTLWAEDGTIFLQQALEDASPRTWIESYAGYAHIVPRMLASVAASVPLEWAPIVLSGGAALVAGLLALVTYCAFAGHVQGAGRAVLAIAVVLLPAAGVEVMNASANIHWYLLFVASWAAVWRPTSRWGVSVACAVLFLTAGSDPFAALLVPVVLWVVVTERRAADLARLFALIIGLLLQAVAIIYFNEVERPLNPFGTPIASLLSWYGFHVLMASVFGFSIRDALIETIGVAASAGLAVAVLAYLLFPAARLARHKRAVPIVLVSLHLGMYFAPVALSGWSPPRYSVTPILLLYSLIAWGCYGAHERIRRAIAMVILAAIVIADFSPQNERARGPAWSEELARGELECSSESADVVTITVPPGRPGDTAETADQLWTVLMPCSRLRHAATNAELTQT